jgi:hypothetical protein
VLVVVGVMLLQAAWILTMPPFRGIDEFDHAYRAAAVARGQWVPGEAAEDGRGQLVVVPRSIVEAAHAQCAALEYTGPDNCNPVTDLPAGKVEVATAAGSYHPAFYWLVGTAALPFEGAAALYAMRIATALFSLLFIGLAAWSVAKLPGRWPTAGLIVAITPVFVYSTTVTAPNGVEMSAGLALWGTLLALVHGQRHDTESRLMWGAILSAVALGSLRILGPVFILMIVATVALVDWQTVREVMRRHKPTVVAGCVLVGASVMVQAWWMFDAVANEVSSEGTSDPKQITPGNVLTWPLQSIAAFPLRTDAGAPIVYAVVLIFATVMILAAWRRDSTRVRQVMLVALLVTLAFPFVFTLATLDAVGNIWQGRYLLPYGVGFLLLAGYALGRANHRSVLPSRLVVPAAAFYGVAVVACMIKIRDDELAHNSASISDGSWHAPSPALLVVITLLAMGCFVVALTELRRAGSHSEPLTAEHVS